MLRDDITALIDELDKEFCLDLTDDIKERLTIEAFDLRHDEDADDEELTDILLGVFPKKQRDNDDIFAFCETFALELIDLFSNSDTDEDEEEIED